VAFYFQRCLSFIVYERLSEAREDRSPTAVGVRALRGKRLQAAGAGRTLVLINYKRKASIKNSSPMRYTDIMRFISRILLGVMVNAFGLWFAAFYIKGFSLPPEARQVLILAAVLTALNFLLKPLLKLILGPVIILTLGLGLILVNGIVLFVLDILSQSLRIEGIPALLYATLLFSAINIVVHLAEKTS